MNRIVLYICMILLTSCISREDRYDYTPPHVQIIDSTFIPPGQDTSFRSVLSQFRLAHFPIVFNTDSELSDIRSGQELKSRNYMVYTNSGHLYGLSLPPAPASMAREPVSMACLWGETFPRC